MNNKSIDILNDHYIKYLKFDKPNERLATLKIDKVINAVNKVCPSIKLEFNKKSNIKTEQDTYHVGIYGLKSLYLIKTIEDADKLQALLKTISSCIEYEDTIGNIRKANHKPDAYESKGISEWFTRAFAHTRISTTGTLYDILNNKEI